MKKYLLLLFLFGFQTAYSQQLTQLTVDKIMRDPKWIGTSPSNIFWSPDNQRIYFDWNPDQEPSDSLYYCSLQNHTPVKASLEERTLALAERAGSFNRDKSELVFTMRNTLYLLHVPTGVLEPLIRTNETISKPRFGFNDTRVVFEKDNNLYSRELSTGNIAQLTDFKSGERRHGDSHRQMTAQERFLENDALHNSQVLRERKAKKALRRKTMKTEAPRDNPRTIYLGTRHLGSISLSPDGRFVVYRLAALPKGTRHTVVPSYVTQSGYTENIGGRYTVGTPLPSFSSYIYDRQKDTVYRIHTEDIPGIREVPEYLKDYPARDSALRAHPHRRSVCIMDPVWNKKTSRGFVEIRSLDHKDRWLMELDTDNGGLKLLDRQHDSAWIGGPDIGWQFVSPDGIGLAYFNALTQVNGDHGHGFVGWVDDHTVWYQSEESGFSHLYTVNVQTGEKKALTSGKYEVSQAELSPDRTAFNIITNRIEPGQHQFYQLDIATGKQRRITRLKGGNDVTVSPDGQHLAIVHSTNTAPWELYLQPNKPRTQAQKITSRAESAEYKSYPWRTPKIITFRDRDGYEVHASLYRPEKQAESHPGVLFVHGAGYLQDVDRWWSYYFREHMFMNLLADQGYTVMDIDYRGSAGYGRYWRTAIYRQMGGKDLDDVIDGAQFMVDSLGVHADKIGIWGGSYGGFMTLMAMFKTRTFACGGALRSVADFAHYNQAYSSAILNTPQMDSIAYVRSSPLYFAEGLHGHLLMCHGMVDTNVHFQDIVRVTQKLIEQGKHHWELAVYPVEGHDFKEASSWTDEYSRVYQLFQTWLK